MRTPNRPNDTSLNGTAATLVAMLSERFWLDRCGAADFIGKEIGVGGQLFSIIDVMGKWFTGMMTGEFRY